MTPESHQSLSAEDILRELRRVLEEWGVPGAGELGPDENLFTQGIVDSITILEIVMRVEQKFGIRFSPSEFEPRNLSTLGGIVNLVIKQIGLRPGDGGR